MMNSFTIFCAKYLVFVVGLITVVYWFKLAKKQKVDLIVFGLIATIVGVILAKVGGALFYDTRPFITDHVAPLLPHGNDNGFPSDHTLVGMIIAITVFSISKRWGAVLMVLALVIGTSRVLAHVHRPIDILGSIVIALIGGMIAYYFTPKITARILK